MRIQSPVWIVSASAALVSGLAVALRFGTMPLGVRGEWEWSRLTVAPVAVDVASAGAGVLVYAGFCGAGMAALGAGASKAREALAVMILAIAAVAAQWVVHSGAPDGYGLAKWVVALSDDGANGYFSVAKREVVDPGRFIAEYPEWITRQDALHIGTHPPGLIVVQAMLLKSLGRSPGATRFVLGHLPDPVARAFRVFARYRPMSPADRATIALTGLVTLLMCSATVIPLYLLARSAFPPSISWAVAALWPLVPSAVLFQPTADTAFPLLSTSALALAAHSGGKASKVRRSTLAGCAGILLATGMQFSLAFLAVGVIVALTVLGDREVSSRGKSHALLATGIGFFGLTLIVWAVSRANPFAVWWWNQKNHARFYAEFPRSYFSWVAINPVELAIGLGLPVACWSSSGLLAPREAPRVGLATLSVLVLLTLSGRSLSEIGRLWLPFMPALIVLAGSAMKRFDAGPKALAATVALVGAQTLILEATVQVVYPI